MVFLAHDSANLRFWKALVWTLLSGGFSLLPRLAGRWASI
jgi:hypothetical protein